MKFGFEKEYFVYAPPNYDYIIVPAGAPKDECGWLAEARGESHSDPLSAAYLLSKAEADLEIYLGKFGVKLDLENSYSKLPKDLVRQATRRFGKNPVGDERRNLYGKDWPLANIQRAGLHVHFSNQGFVEGKNGTVPYSRFFDPIPIIRALDKKFATAIKANKRIPGEYELKSYGFEYRSLPSNVSAREVALFIREMNL